MTRIMIAKPDDLGILLKLAIKFRDDLERSLPTEEEFKEGITILLNSDDAEFLLLKDDDDKTVGYILQRYFYSMWLTGYEARIEDLFVDSYERGKGYGRILVTNAIQRAKEYECKSIFLDTNENNAASNKIYTELGFKCESKRWDGGSQVFYRLSLE